MSEYWITFRIASGATYQEKYDTMLKAMVKIRGASWGEPTSFWLVSSNLEIDAFTRALVAGLDAETDLLCVRKLSQDQSRYFGAIAHLDVLKEFLPNIKKAG